jgi:glutamine synthetase
MLLMPDAGAAYIDPFMDETTLNITCDVIEPSDGKGYERDPRSLAKRAEAYLKSTGSATPRISARSPSSSSSTRSSGRSTCREAIARCFLPRPRGRRRKNSKAATWATGHGQGRLLPGPAGRFAARHPVRHVPRDGAEGVEVEVHHHEVANAGQCEIGTKFETLVKRADWLQILKYAVHNTAHALRQDRRRSCRSPSWATTVRACMSTNPSGRRQEPVRG